jgi:hypothetical protein
MREPRLQKRKRSVAADRFFHQSFRPDQEALELLLCLGGGL